MSTLRKFYFQFYKMTTDGFSLCILPSIVFDRIKYNQGIGYVFNVGFLIWLIKIEYFFYKKSDDKKDYYR